MVDIKKLMSNIKDSHQFSENNMRDVVTEVGSQSIKNNDRNNQKEMY